jgi:hypothetical protein
MNEIRIGTKEDRTGFRPGEMIEGAVGWNLSEQLQSIEVRLAWQTRGKGTEDHQVVHQMQFDDPPLQGARPFQFVAPFEPFSFSGKLISVMWYLEVKVRPDRVSARTDIIIAPAGKELLLGEPAPSE